MWPPCDVAERLRRIVRSSRQPHPQHVDRRAEILDGQAGALAHDRAPAVGADDEIGADLLAAARRLDADADDAAALLDQIGDRGLHAQLEGVERARVVGEEIEEVPLRHQRQELAVRRQVGEVGDGHCSRRRRGR